MALRKRSMMGRLWLARTAWRKAGPARPRNPALQQLLGQGSNDGCAVWISGVNVFAPDNAAAKKAGRCQNPVGRKLPAQSNATVPVGPPLR